MDLRSQRFLDEGERVEFVVWARSRAGLYLIPFLSVLPVLATMLMPVNLVLAGVAFVAASVALVAGSVYVVKNRILCWTDRSLIVFVSSPWSATPTSVRARLPRDKQLGRVSGIWSTVDVDGERLVIHRRFHHDVEAAQATAAST